MALIVLPVEVSEIVIYDNTLRTFAQSFVQIVCHSPRAHKQTVSQDSFVLHPWWHPASVSYSNEPGREAYCNWQG